MITGDGPDVFKGNLQRFQSVWGVSYPVKNKRDDGQASLNDAGEESTIEVKTVLPWFNQEEFPSVELRKRFRNAATAYDFDGYTASMLQGMPHPANAIRRFVELVYTNEFNAIDKTKYSVNKAVLGLMGLSSVEYQFDNLSKDKKSDFTKPIAKSWNSTAVSGLRDLFGGLGESSGWSVKNAWYVGPGREMEKEDLFKLLQAFWPDITSKVEACNFEKLKKEMNLPQPETKRRNESANDSIEIKCN